MKSIRASIVTYVIAAIVTASAIGVVISIVIIRQRLFDEFDHNLMTKAEAIASLVEPEEEDDPVPLELDDRDEALGDFQNRSQPTYFELRDEHRKTVDRSLYLDKSLDVDLPERASPYTESLLLPDGRQGRVAVLPIIIAHMVGATTVPSRDAQEDETPSAWILVAAGTETVSATLRNVIVVLVLCFGVVAAAVIVLVPRLVDRGLRPLDEMTRRTAELDANRLSTRYPVDNLPTELRPIATQLNTSLEQIESAFERERRFASAAAHELRTPLAAIRTNAEVTLRFADPVETEASLRRIVTSSQRMQSLVDRLLRLARAEHTALDLDDAVRVAEAVNESVRSHQATLDRRGIGVTIDIPARFVVKSHAPSLQLVLDNLIANAAQHAAEGSMVEIAADADRGAMTVTNRSNDLTAADLERIVEPFWTQPADRSSGNAGLGLSLVASYAKLLNITVNPALLADGRFRQTLQFETSATST